MTAPMTTGHRLALLNLLHDTDHLVWLHRYAIDQGHDACSTPEHLRLVDHASRASALARSLLDGDNGRRDTSAGFKPAPNALRDRLRGDLAARRRHLEQGAAPAASSGPPPETPSANVPPPAADPNFDPAWRDAEPDLDSEHHEPAPDDQGGGRRRRMRPR